MLLPRPCVGQPAQVSYQGELRKDGQLFTGDAFFKFVIVDGTGASLWSNDGTSQGGAEPQAAVQLAVARGIFSTRLGAVPMVPLSANLIKGVNDAALRVWVNTGGVFEQLTDQPISSSAFALASDETNQIGAQATDFLAKWNGLALVQSGLVERNGKIGIGTSDPVADLHIFHSNALARLRLEGSGQANRAWDITSSNRSGMGCLNFFAAGTSAFVTVQDNGTVGIGTSDPLADLHIFHSNALARLRLEGSGQANRAWDITSSNRSGMGCLNFFAAGTSAFVTVQDNGTVGIGTTDPAETLSVAGVIQSLSGGFRFPDGSVQVTASAGGEQGPAGPQGPPGPQGPAGPAVHTHAVCSNIGYQCANFGVFECVQICGGSQWVEANACGACTATSDTGSCPGPTNVFVCCVCRPH
jgi:hypothetical protein